MVDVIVYTFACVYYRVFSRQLIAIIATCIVWIPVTYLAFRLLCFWIRRRASGQLPHLRKVTDGQKPLLIGFFHPYCNAGGGGERVLWIAVQALQTRLSNYILIIMKKCTVLNMTVDLSQLYVSENKKNRKKRPVGSVLIDEDLIHF